METVAPVRPHVNRLLAADARSAELGPLPMEPSSVVQGTPTAGLLELGEHPSPAVGIWELSPGKVTDTEVDEVFVVLAGQGVVTFADGTVVELRPGAVVRLHVGDRTTWQITETVRKVYVAF